MEAGEEEDQRDGGSGRIRQPGVSLARDNPRDFFLLSFCSSLMSLQTLRGKQPSECLKGVFKFASNICEFHSIS